MARSLGEQLSRLRLAGPIGGSVADAISRAASVLRQWESGAIDAQGLRHALIETEARARLANRLFPSSSSADGALRTAMTLAELNKLLSALSSYAEAFECCIAGGAANPEPISFHRAYDLTDAFWASLRASLTVALVGGFWILSAWPHGSTATILAAVANARLATMGRGVAIAEASVMIFSLATVPAFIVVEVLLPHASDFPSFAVIVGPVLFGCAYLMSGPSPKTMLMGYLSALLFASVGQFQNSMVYDPVGLLNTAIAAVFASGVTLVLWSIVAPATPEAARRRFLRIARKAVASLAAPRRPIGLAEFETCIAEAIDQLQSGLHLDQPGDRADLAAAGDLLSLGSMLKPLETDSETILARYTATPLEPEETQFFTEPEQQELRHAA